jgi:hypothetical protein
VGQPKPAPECPAGAAVPRRCPGTGADVRRAASRVGRACRGLAALTPIGARSLAGRRARYRAVLDALEGDNRVDCLAPADS